MCRSPESRIVIANRLPVGNNDCRVIKTQVVNNGGHHVPAYEIIPLHKHIGKNEKPTRHDRELRKQERKRFKENLHRH